MNIKHKLYAWLLVLLIAAPSSVGAQLLESFHFKNMSVGFGLNRTDYDFGYLDVTDYFNDALKQSFLIDLRANFYGPYDLIITPTYELWSWTDHSGTQPDLLQNGVSDNMISLDVSKVFAANNSFSSYIGGGVGIHFLTYFTNFPRQIPFFQNGTFNQIQNITKHTSVIAPGLIAGLEYKLWEDFYISSEIRREFSNDLKQWKILVNFSMF